jgi:flagellar motor protein MotB
MEEESVMSKSWTLGIVGLLLAAAGCVPSDQYLDMKSKYDQERMRADRLQTENERLRDQNRALAARGGSGMTQEEMEKWLAAHPPTGGVTFTGTPGATPIKGGGILLEDLTFRSGSADLTDRGKAALDNVGEQIRKYGAGTLEVDGHTDTDPIRSSNNASNWELSGKRAAAVVDYLVKKGAVDPREAVLRGFGQYHPISSEKSKNRRVEIRYYPNSGSGAAPGGASEAPAERTRPAGSGSSRRDPTLK